MQAKLSSLGVHPASQVQASAVAKQLFKLGLGAAPVEPKWLPSEVATLPDGALPLFQALDRATSASPSSGIPNKILEYPWTALPPTKRKADEAYATLLTTADDAYLAGALTLGSSIRAFDTLRELLVLVTEAVPVTWHEELRNAGFEVVVVDEMQEFWWGRKHARCQSYHPDQDARWGHEMTKLRYPLTYLLPTSYLPPTYLLLTSY